MCYRGIVLLVCLLFPYWPVQAQLHSVKKQDRYQLKKHKKRDFFHKGAYYLGEIVVDALRLNLNVLSLDSVKVFTGILPFYLLSRMADEDIQSHFYDRSCHKNIHQLPEQCYKAAKYGISIPMIGLSSLAFFAPNEDIRITARMFGIGLPFVQSGKDIIKKLDCKACLRPWHQDFSREKRSCGGFPSGHVANVTFMATLFGIRHGPAWGIPLGLFAGFVFVEFLTCNRHYLSQLFAGAGLGVMFALAANKLIEEKLSDTYALSMVTDQKGNPGLQVAYQF